MKTYDEEIEKRESQIINIKNDIEKMDGELATVRRTYQTRKAEVASWLEYKEKKRLKEEQRAKEERAAVKIQVKRIC